MEVERGGWEKNCLQVISSSVCIGHVFVFLISGKKKSSQSDTGLKDKTTPKKTKNINFSERLDFVREGIKFGKCPPCLDMFP